MKLRKALAILLSLMMVFTNVPAIAFADAEVSSEETGETSDDQSYEEALAAAAKAAEEQAAAQQYEIDQNTYTENDDTWTSVDEIVSPELGEPDEEEYAPEPEYEPEYEPEPEPEEESVEEPEETATVEPEQEATPQPQAEVETNEAEAKEVTKNVVEETKVTETVTFASIVTNAKGKLNGLLAGKSQEKSFPEFNAGKTIAGTSMRVVVEAPEGAFPEGIQLFAGVVNTPAEVLDAIADDMGEEVSQSDTLSVDIHFYLPEDPETEIEPLIPINVTFSNINLDAEVVDVYHETEKIAEVDGEGGTVELDQFSTYTFVVNPGSGGSDYDEFYARNITVKPGDGGSATVIIEENGVAITDFTGWTFTSANTGIATVDADGTVTPVTPGRTTITAVAPNGESSLSIIVDTYALVKYDMNGGEGAIADTEYGGRTPSAQAAGASDRTGYKFLGWSENPDALAATYGAGADLSGLFATLGADADSWVKTLYAVWEPQISFNVTKVWDDDDNRDGIRPASVSVERYYSTDGVTWTSNGTATLTDGNWTKVWGPQRTRTSGNGTPLYFKIVEATAMGGYSTSATAMGVTVPMTNEVIFTPDDIADIVANDGAVANVEFTNTHAPEKITLTVSKVWNDDNDHDKKRPDPAEVEVVVTGDDGSSETRTVTDAQAVDIELFKYNQGILINYTLTETAVEDYDTTYDGATACTFTGTAGVTDETKAVEITNTHEPELVEINVEKVWNDNDDAAGERPAKVNIRVFQNGRYIRNAALSDAINWQTTIKGKTTDPFYKYDTDGTEFTYTIEESSVATDGASVPIENYETAIAGDVENGFTVTNTYIPPKTTVTINKTWEDYEDANETRPDAVTIRLMNNGVPVRRTTMHAADGWTKTFTDVPTKDAAGNLINYYVEEENVEGYVASYKKEGDVLNGYTFTVTNKNEIDQEYVQISVKKVWVDADNQDGIRPTDISWKLEGSVNGQVVVTRNVEWTGGKSSTTISKDDDGNKLPKYYNGHEVEYSVTENPVAGYTTEITGNATEGFIMTNTHEPETIDITVEKVWDDRDDADEVRPEMVQIFVEGNDGSSHEAQIEKAENWTHTIEDLPKYKAGVEIEYSVREVQVAEYEAPVITGDAANGFTITNTHEVKRISIQVKKKWNDVGNADGIRTAAGMHLEWKEYLGTSEVYPGSEREVGITEDEFVVTTYDDLPVYKNGTKIIYFVHEDNLLDSYTVTSDWESDYGHYTAEAGGGKYDWIGIDAEDAFLNGGGQPVVVEFTNTHPQETLSIIPAKSWDDNNDQDGKRAPAEITVEKVVGGTATAVGTATSDTSWGWFTPFSISGLPVYENGQPILYRITETPVDGYTAKIGAWSGSYEQEVEGNVIEFLSTDLPLNRAPSTGALTRPVFLDLENTHEPEKIDVTVTKEWDDADNQDGIRPESVVVNLMIGDEAVKDEDDNPIKATLSVINNWTVTFEGLPKYEAGTELAYDVQEELPADSGYTATKTGTKDDGFVITNTHEPKTITVTAQKVWDDDNNRDQKRPEKITYHLFADGVNIKSVSTDQETYEFTDLPFYKAGVEINYVVVEASVPDYATSYVKEDPDDDGNFTWTITNKYEPETSTITAVKVWDDNGDKDGIRPDEVSFKLQFRRNDTADWEDVPAASLVAGSLTQAVSEDNGWMASWTVKDNSKTGKPLQFKAIEVEVPEGYTSGVVNNDNTWTITNTHEAETFFILIEKEWVDDNDRDGIRPESVTFDVVGVFNDVAGDQHVSEQTVTLTKTSSDGNPNKWYRGIEVPKYANGNPMNYLVTEHVPAGYECSPAEVIITAPDDDSVPRASFTNTHNPATVTINVTKVWDDANNQDGVRPDEVYAQVYANGEYKRQKELNEENGWTNTITAMKQYKYENGKEIKYEIKENWVKSGHVFEDPNGNYTTEIAGSVEDGFTITNTHEPKTIDVTVKKTWDDENNRDGFRPEYIEVSLVTGDTTVGEERLSAQNNWKVTFTDLPAYKDGEAIEYEAKEQRIAKYEQTSGDGDIAKVGDALTINLVNKHEPETVNVNVSKTWNDDNNRDRKRPENITLHLYANGKNIDSVTTAETQYVFEDLPRYENATEINYVVAEIPVEDYTTEYATSKDADGNTTWDITNSYNPEMITITAIKEWDDDNDRDGLRKPVDVTLQQKGTGDWKDYATEGTKTLSDENNWTATWDVLKYYRASGDSDHEFQYQVVEKTAPDGYTATYANTDGVWTVKNTHEPATGSLQIKKVWDDDSNRDGLRPATLNIYVTANGRRVPGLEKQLASTGVNWWYKFENLPLYENGKLITYAFEEDLPDGYTVTYGDAVQLVAGKNKLITVTNTHEPEVLTIPLTKIWDDANDQDGMRENAVFKLKAYNTINGGAIKNADDNPVERNFTYNKNSTDTLPLTKDDYDAPLYAYYKGKPINYVLTEEPMDGYTATIEGSAREGFTVTNTHEPATADITVIKTWEDQNNNDGFRPDSLQIKLSDDDPNGTNDPIMTQGMSAADGWITVFKDLPVYRNGGEAIKYTVEEEMDDWVDYYEDSDPDDQKEVDITLEDGDYVASLVNTHEVMTVKILITKIWDDENNHDDARPDDITFTLFANGVPAGTFTVPVDKDSSEQVYGDEASEEIELSLFFNGEMIAYSVVEEAVEDYTTTYFAETSGGGDDPIEINFKVTNKHEPGMTTITAIKEWDDANDQDGKRPDSVTVKLEADGTIEFPAGVEAEVELNEANNWQTSWNVPVQEHATGKVLKYNVTETAVPEYTTTYAETNGVFTIKNTHVPATGSLQIKKVWNDDSNRDGLRPTTMNVYVTANGLRVPGLEKQLMGTGVNWWYKFENLPLYENGQLITYAFEEDVPDGYTVDYGTPTTLVADKNKLITVTNTHEPKVLTIPITKIWDDNDDQDGLRENPQFTLTGYNTINNGKIAGVVRHIDFNKNATEPLNVSEDDNGNMLYAFYKGSPVKYVLTEDEIPGYTTVIEGSAEEGFVVTNTHIPKTIDVTVTKTWDDADDQDGMRPEYLEIKLMADGKEVAAERLSAENNWKKVFEDLPAYEKGTAIEYTVVETVPAEYTQTAGSDATDVVTVDSGTIALENKHEPELTKVIVTKIWDDENNHDMKRPENILYTLYANGRSVDSVVVTGNVYTDEDWGHVFDNIPKYENGEEITYTVTEHSISEYTTVMDQLVDPTGVINVEFTNTYAPGQTTITAIKEWDDANDQDGKRPDSVTVTLKADGEIEFVKPGEKAEAELKEANNWQKSWDVFIREHGTGKELTFDVEETAVPEYTTTYAETDGVFTVKNTHVPETGSLKIKKVWDDDSNRDGLRPTVMNIYVTADGLRVPGLEKQLMGSGVNWWYTFDDLPLYKDGELITYGIEEDVPDGYTADYGTPTTLKAGTYKLITMTNTHEPKVLTIPVTKVWDDNDDQDGLRQNPQFTLTGYNTINTGKIAGVERHFEFDKERTEPMKLTQDDSGNKLYAFYKGSPVKYVLTEEEIPGYTTVIEGSAEEGFVVTNTHEPKIIDVTVTKTWDDADDQDGMRPEYLEIKLMADGQEVDSERLSSMNNWKRIFTDLPAYKEGTAIKYTVVETVPEGYEQTAGNKEEDVVTVDSGTIALENKHEPKQMLIVVKKTWEDEKNQDGVRPDSLRITLLADGAPYEAYTLTPDDDTELEGEHSWAHVFLDLPRYKDGKEIVYSVVEESIDNYTAVIREWTYEELGLAPDDHVIHDIVPGVEDEIGAMFIEIINKHVPGVRDVTVVKTWDDDHNRDGLRPESVTVNLMADGEAAKDAEGNPLTHEMTESEGWVYTFKAVPINKPEGKAIAYTVEEAATDVINGDAATGYKAEYINMGGEGGFFRIINKHEPTMIDIQVEKVWSDMYNWDGIRPTHLALKLTANGKLVAGQEIDLANSEDYKWHGVFKDLPVYENGQPIEYSVIEEVPDGYEAYIIPYNTQEFIDDNTSEPKITVQNMHEIETTNVTVNKIWDDGDDVDGYREAARKGFKLGLLMSVDGKEYEPVDTYIDEIEMIAQAMKELIESMEYATEEERQAALDEFDAFIKEAEEALKERPHLEVGLDEEDLKDDSYTWEALPARYKGGDVTYRVVEFTDESEAASKYTAEVEEVAPGMFEVTNTHELDTVSHTVTIKWDDNNNQDGLRPAYVNVYLMKDGVRTDDPVVALTAANGWTYTWENLLAGEYTTAEETPGENPDELQEGAGPDAPATAGTKAAYSADAVAPIDPDVYTKTSVTTEGDKTTIGISYVPKTITVKGNKYWEDDSNRDGARPDSIKVNLYADGDLTKTIEVTADNALADNSDVWAYEFKDVPKYIDGNLVTYTVSEEAVANYTLRVDGFDLHNKYTPGKTFVTVIKLWSDDRNRDGVRPENIIVRLLANGEEINRKSISAASGWFAVFDGLDMKADQKDVTYTITEDAVQDYESSIAGDQKAGYVITNTHTSERTEVPVTKIWDDDNNSGKTRPASITVNLLVEGRVVDTRVLTEADGWKTTFKDLPKYSNGKAVVYTISENEVSGYTASITGYTIVNTLKAAPKKCDNGGAAGGSSSGRRSGGVKTGDNTNIAIWIVLLAAACIAMVLVRRMRRTR